MKRCRGDFCGGSWCLIILFFIALLCVFSRLWSALGVWFQLFCLVQVKFWFRVLGSVTSLAPHVRSRTC
ncbi:unnamed protein product [Brassica napus]|uniref:(rape) hypothetical protein n=1 Tax=Brassica napus TaxID=3708 RepID=A0A817B160_BRANA|nr:unnamed protein product [Brassica napus]